MSNGSLKKAKRVQNNEFYTRYEDIEKELKIYTDYNPDLFRGKTILCPCDDWEWSNFTQYLDDHFSELGIGKLICTCIAEHPNLQIAFDENVDEKQTHGKYYIHTAQGTEHGLLKDTGDFRSPEVTGIKDKADFVITNPPFSLAKDFLNWCDKAMMVIVSLATIGCVKPFDKIISDSVHIGYNTVSKFKTGGEIKNVTCVWLTNIEPKPRHPFLKLTAEYKGNEADYPYYDNYNAINVDRVTDIPKDWDGVMGVPISFLQKWNPEQFEVVKYGYGDDGNNLTYGGRAECPFYRMLIKPTVST